MRDPNAILLADAREALLRAVVQQISTSDHGVEAGFAAWIAEEPEFINAFRKHLQPLLGSTKRFRQYQDVGELGYANAAGLLSGEDPKLLESALSWLSGRTYQMAGELIPLVADELALLGIALGASTASNPVQELAQNWIRGLLPKCFEVRESDSWKRSILVAVGRLVISTNQPSLPTDERSADICVALRRKGILRALKDDDRKAEELGALKLRKDTIDGLSAARAAARISAWDWISRESPSIVPNRMDVGDVGTLLRNVERGFTRWTWEKHAKTSRANAVARQWQVDHEYHVQNLLWFLLSPIFPDLTDEFYTPKVGTKNPRADLGIPSLKLIIEVKFMREGTQSAISEMIGQVSEDAGLYFVEGTSYSQMIPFIWDNSRSVEKHHLLVEGLRKLPRVQDAVVVSRPGCMDS